MSVIVSARAIPARCCVIEVAPRVMFEGTTPALVVGCHPWLQTRCGLVSFCDIISLCRVLRPHATAAKAELPGQLIVELTVLLRRGFGDHVARYAAVHAAPAAGCRPAVGDGGQDRLRRSVLPPPGRAL